MSPHPVNKHKIINDPVYGFIKIPNDLVYELMEHPWFQRLRRIKQLGLTHLVYPGALHTRFHHALGAMWLTTQAIDNLKLKGVQITDEEAEGTTVAVLLHDIGHGPFSHALEHTIVPGISHEAISVAMMEALNKGMDGRLQTALAIFNDTYPKKFLHQLVSGQIDMDRLDYLRRDCFFTGVLEGMVGSDRIIKMLHVKNDELVVEAKGIYSMENFVVSRRLMYWQVYLHKTVIAAEQLLTTILKRARQLAHKGEELFATPALYHFLYENLKGEEIFSDPNNLEYFTNLDDNDITASIKVWQSHHDDVLAMLCSNLLNRRLPEVTLSNAAEPAKVIDARVQHIRKKYNLSIADAKFMVMHGVIKNNAYTSDANGIKILFQDGSIKDLARASDQDNISALSKTVKKYYTAWYE